MKTNHVILGDCFEVLKDFPDNSVDLVFTSPPYNRKRNDKYEHFEDSIDDYCSYLLRSVKECMRVSKGWVIFNLQKTYYNKADIFAMIGYFRDLIVEIIVWAKTNPRPNDGLKITNAYEFFIVFGNTPLTSNSTYTKNVIETSVNTDMPEDHKAVMKQEVSDWFIEKFSKPNDVILDPFAGTGTTLISCKRFEREYIGIEIAEEYYNMILENLSQTTISDFAASFLNETWTESSEESSSSQEPKGDLE